MLKVAGSSIVISIAFSASALAQGLPQFHQEVDCSIKAAKLLKGKDIFNGMLPGPGDLAILCEANSAQVGVACMTGVAQDKTRIMTPLGIATVCSRGTSAIDALKCLKDMAPKFDKGRWVAVVDACTGTARQASVCAGSENALTCTAFPAGRGGSVNVEPAAY